MARIYRLYTQDLPNVAEITSKYFPEGFTIYHGDGYWKGGSEKNATIEILIVDRHDFDMADRKVRDLTNEIKEVNHQEAILKVDYEVYATLR